MHLRTDFCIALAEEDRWIRKFFLNGIQENVLKKKAASVSFYIFFTF